MKAETGRAGAPPAAAGSTVATPAAARLLPAGPLLVAGAPPVPGVLPVANIRADLAAVPVAADGPGMIDQLRMLEDLKSLAAAKQAEIAVALDLSRRREQAAAGVRADELGAGGGC